MKNKLPAGKLKTSKEIEKKLKKESSRTKNELKEELKRRLWLEKLKRKNK